MSDLQKKIPDGSGWTLERAAGIDNAGRIVGHGTVKSKGKGSTQAFLLTQIPEQ